MTKRFVFFFAVLFITAGLASAATSGPFTTSTPISATKTDWSSSLAFQKFNSSLGNLTSVQIDLVGDMNTVLTITNNSESSSNGHALTHLQLTVQDSGLHLNAPEIDVWSSSFSYSLAANSSTTSGNLTKHYTSSDLYTLSSILTEFTGTGNISLNASTYTETSITNFGGNTFSDQATKASLDGTVTYTYDPVPEPVTISLLCMGALAFLKRKNSK